MIYEGTWDMGSAKHGLVQHPPYTLLAAWPHTSFLVHVRVAWKVESLNILDRRMLKCETLSGPQHAWLSKPLVGIKWQAGEIKFSEGSNCGWQKLFCKHITTFLWIVKTFMLLGCSWCACARPSSRGMGWVRDHGWIWMIISSPDSDDLTVSCVWASSSRPALRSPGLNTEMVRCIKTWRWVRGVISTLGL